MADRYLRVQFGDNDFGIPVDAALTRIWGYMDENNGSLVDSLTPRTITKMFRELHEAGALILMVTRAVDCEDHYMEIESATRCLYWEKVNWKGNVADLLKPFESITTAYLNIELSFHAKMSEKWANGEEAWLDLETGKVESR